jgi:hypothetical protein
MIKDWKRISTVGAFIQNNAARSLLPRLGQLHAQKKGGHRVGRLLWRVLLHTVPHTAQHRQLELA